MRIRDVRALSFDGDDTLWDFTSAMRQALSRVLSELQREFPGQASSSLTVEEMIGIRDGVAAEMSGACTSLAEVRLLAFQRTLAGLGVSAPALARRLNERYRRYRFSAIALFPDVLPVLDSLPRHVRLGLLTNGNTGLDVVGLERRLSFAVYAEDFGVSKPDPRLFQIAAGEAGCLPAQLLHVGDSLTSDVAGAQAAGLPAVWLNRSGAANDTGLVPDFVIASLAELPGLLL